MTTAWDDPRVAQLEASLERCMHDHGCVCTEMHQFRRERDAIQARLKDLIEAASAFGLPDNPAFDTPREQKLRAVLSRAKGE